jgi:L-ascorbate metabolism protein UlaG (beta-lactamase superfamily)
MRIRTRFILIALLASLGAALPVLADSGKPVAVRWWGQAMVSIETYWGLTVVIDPFPPNIGYDDPQLAADLVLITHEHPDHNHAQIVRGQPTVVHGLDEQGKVRAVHHVLDRLPNALGPTWQSVDAAGERSGHEIVVQTIPAWHDDEEGGARGGNALFVVDVDGVRIVHCGDLGQAKLTDEQLAALGRVDVLFVPVGGIYTVDGPQAAEIIDQVNPRFAIPIHFKTPALSFQLHGIEPFIEAVRNRFELTEPERNTLAVSALSPGTIDKTRVVVLAYEPWQPSGELVELFARKEAASRASQAVFEPLTVEQMNFRPTDSTHTPRWNAEHMMGRELMFFTQVYHSLDPAIPAIDVNPAQMPADYRPAHPDWNGAEEARQMERVTGLVRRYAYLLDGVDLDEPAPGSRWTLRRLFRQMEDHYGQHTVNVQAKFDLPDWPRK